MIYLFTLCQEMPLSLQEVDPEWDLNHGLQPCQSYLQGVSRHVVKLHALHCCPTGTITAWVPKMYAMDSFSLTTP